MMKRKSLHVQAGEGTYFMVLTCDQGRSICAQGNMFLYEGTRYSGYFIISTRTDDYDDDDAIIISFSSSSSTPSSHPPVSQCLCLLTKHRYRLQLNILIISLN